MKKELAVVRRVVLDAGGVGLHVDLLIGSTIVEVPWSDVKELVTEGMTKGMSFSPLVGETIVVEESESGRFSFHSLKQA